MPDYDSLQRKRNFIVGAFVIIGASAFVWLIFIFGEMPLAVNRLRSYSIYVHFPSAPGVQKNTPVQYCGYQIGRVATVAPPRTVKYNGGMECRITLELLIDKKFSALPDTSTFSLVKRGLGSSYIELDTNPDLPVKDFIKPNQAYVGQMRKDHQLFPKELRKKFEKLVENLTRLSGDAELIIGDPDNRENIKKSLANITELTEQAKATIESVQKMSEQGKVSLASADENFAKMAESIVSISEEINATLAQARVSLEKINDGDGTAARFVNDPRLYESLLESTYELQSVLQELKALTRQTREKGLKIKL